MAKKTQEQYIKEVITVHGDGYDLSDIVYTAYNCKINPFCKKEGHGFFKIDANQLLHSGCQKCSGMYRPDTAEFIRRGNEMHNGKFGYDRSTYTTKNGLVEIFCPEPDHGYFFQRASDHTRAGHGCPKCGIKKNLTTEQFIINAQKIHKDKYGYTPTVYVNSDTKVAIECFRHGIFYQMPGDHCGGHGCPKCIHNISTPETKWLNSLGIKEENRQISLPGLGNRYKFDGYDPETNTVYEFHGDFWHGNPNRYPADKMNNVLKKTHGEIYQKTINRENKIRAAGYNLVVMWESDFEKHCLGQ